MPGRPGCWNLDEIAAWKHHRPRDPESVASCTGVDAKRRLAADVHPPEAEAAQKELENKLAEGDMVRRDVVDRKVSEKLIEIRTRLRSIPRRMMPRFPQDQADDLTQALGRVIDDALRDLAKWRPSSRRSRKPTSQCIRSESGYLNYPGRANCSTNTSRKESKNGSIKLRGPQVSSDKCSVAEDIAWYDAEKSTFGGSHLVRADPDRLRHRVGAILRIGADQQRTRHCLRLHDGGGWQLLSGASRRFCFRRLENGCRCRRSRDADWQILGSFARANDSPADNSHTEVHSR